ncbi:MULTISPECIES: chaplin [unclassified Streptomyces]|uniref:chaplin n=1 Tax=unclassified Streptomyces TaxID=2593676 RepID=UPI0020340A10|nr:chaplin [Streptomyces sp. RKAG290]MCM2415062.1 chaplin [Streptomyces sp. RKAG290]
MRQVTRKGLITMAAAGGVLALSGGYAHADAGASGGASNSPGVLSGNSVQIPVEVPVNVCGNSVSVVGLLNPTAGNACGNGSEGAVAGRSGSTAGKSGSHAAPGRTSGSRATHDRGQGAQAGTGKHRAVGSDNGGGATAQGYAQGSPGLLSGNQLQVPIDIPVNACGNSVTIGGLLNPSLGNSCENDSTPPVDVPVTPVHEAPPAPGPRHIPNAPEPQSVPETTPQLAHTGSGGLDLLIPASAGLLLAGAGTVLYRRGRAA